MTNKDKQVWLDYTKSIVPTSKKVRTTPTSTVPRAEKDGDKALSRRSATKVSVSKTAVGGEGLDKSVFHALERRREKTLRLGDIEIEGKIDLHGMTQDEAFHALASFIRRKAKAGKRHLLIITGKGGPKSEGVLRRNLPQWLGMLPEASSILALRPAAPVHGGEGAFYVILRRPKAS